MKKFDKNISGENIFDENIFGEYIFVKIFLDHSLITKDFPFLTKVPLLHLHPFEVKCDKLTYAMSVPFIVLDLHMKLVSLCQCSMHANNVITPLSV